MLWLLRLLGFKQIRHKRYSWGWKLPLIEVGYFRTYKEWGESHKFCAGGAWHKVRPGEYETDLEVTERVGHEVHDT